MSLPDGSVDLVVTYVPGIITKDSCDIHIDIDRFWKVALKVLAPGGVVVLEALRDTPMSDILRQSCERLFYKEIFFDVENQGRSILIFGDGDVVMRSFYMLHEAHYHSGAIPVMAAMDIIAQLTSIGDCVFDPFMGSGQYGLASMRLDRKFRGSEIMETMFSLCKERLCGWA